MGVSKVTQDTTVALFLEGLPVIFEVKILPNFHCYRTHLCMHDIVQFL